MPSSTHPQRRYRTGDQNWVRERNLSIVLRYIWDAGQPIARARLTEISGLNKSTMGNLLTQLQAWRFVRETGTVTAGPGRPGTLIDIDSDGGRLIGAEIGVNESRVSQLHARAIQRLRKALGADCSTMEAAAALRPAIVAFQQTMRRMRMAKASLGQSDQPGVVLQYKAKPKPIARRSSAGHILAAAR